jgi:hypothetical protein
MKALPQIAERRVRRATSIELMGTSSQMGRGYASPRKPVHRKNDK